MTNIYTNATLMLGEQLCPVAATHWMHWDTVLRKAKHTLDLQLFSGFIVNL